MKVQGISESGDTLCLKSDEKCLYPPLHPHQDKNLLRKSRKHRRTEKSTTQRHAVRHRRCRTEFKKTGGRPHKIQRKVERYFPQCGTPGSKVAKRVPKEKLRYSRWCKVEDGDRGKIKKTLKQPSKDQEARALLEEMQQNVDEATPQPLKPSKDCVESSGSTCTHGRWVSFAR